MPRSLVFVQGPLEDLSERVTVKFPASIMDLVPKVRDQNKNNASRRGPKSTVGERLYWALADRQVGGRPSCPAAAHVLQRPKSCWFFSFTPH